MSELDAGAPHLTRAQVRELDRIAIEELGIPGVVLMENAGRGAAEAILDALAAQRLRPRGAARRPLVLVLCGAGNNGGDGYVLARHLSNAGLAVRLGETAAPARLCPDAAVFRRVSFAMGLEHLALEDARAFAAARPWLDEAELLVDALVGTGFQGEVRQPLAGILGAAGELAARRSLPVVALDLPSGLDADTGAPSNATLRADLTLTFAAPKAGFAFLPSRAFTGEVRVVSIGTPPELLTRVLGRI